MALHPQNYIFTEVKNVYFQLINLLKIDYRDFRMVINLNEAKIWGGQRMGSDATDIILFPGIFVVARLPLIILLPFPSLSFATFGIE